MRYITSKKVMIDVQARVNTVPALEAIERYLRVKDENIARGNMVVAKRVEMSLKEYKSSEVDRIAQLVESMRVKKVIVMSFG